MPNHAISQYDNEMCAKEVFCRLPFYTCRQVHTNGYWLPGPEPLIRQSGTLTMEKKEKLNKSEHRLTFQLSGSHLISFMVRPKSTISLKKWSFTPTIPEPNVWNNQQAYFVMITHGLDAGPMNITMVVESEIVDFDGPLVDITIVTTHWENHREFTPIFTTFLSRVPSWAFVVPSVASLTSLIF
jgi:hypothetical protein